MKFKKTPENIGYLAGFVASIILIPSLYFWGFTNVFIFAGIPLLLFLAFRKIRSWLLSD